MLAVSTNFLLLKQFAVFFYHFLFANIEPKPNDQDRGNETLKHLFKFIKQLNQGWVDKYFLRSFRKKPR